MQLVAALEVEPDFGRLHGDVLLSYVKLYIQVLFSEAVEMVK